jgi:hypothetical protein
MKSVQLRRRLNPAGLPVALARCYRMAIVRKFPHLPLPVALALAFLGTASVSVGTAVYVDHNGNDANPGTPDRPLRSLEALSRRVWAPGDAVYFRGGEIFIGALKMPGGGSDSRPVIVGSYGTGRATIDSAGDTLFFGYNQGGFQFQDLNLRSSQWNDSASGILFYSDSPVGMRYPAVTVKNCDLRGFGGAGIKIGSSQPTNPGWSKVRAENCRSSGNGEGMATYGYDTPMPARYGIGSLQVTHCEFAGNRGTGLSISGVSSGLVEYSSFHDNQRVGGCWTWAARDVVIQHCIAYANRRGSDNDGFGFDLDGGSIGCTIQYSLSYQNDTAGFAIFDYPNSADTTGDTIRYCISENDVRSDKEGASYEMNSWANTPIRNSYIYNCVACQTSHGGGSICAGFMGIGRQSMYGWQSGSISGCGFWNNIIYLAGGGNDLAHLYCQYGADSPSEISYAGNDYASSYNRPPRILTSRGLYTSLALWRRNTGQERLGLSRGFQDCGISADPRCAQIGQSHRLIDPAILTQSTIWRPLPNSPCLRAGLDLRKQFRINPGRIDFYGNPLPETGSITIGAAGPNSILR